MKLDKTIKLDELNNACTCSRQQIAGCSRTVYLDIEGVILDRNYKIIDSSNCAEPTYCLCNFCLNGLEFNDDDELIIN